MSSTEISTSGRWPMCDVVTTIIAAQQGALQAAKAAAPAFSAAIEALAEKLRAGGRMAYAGAGSSGVIAQLDALELPGTFGIDPHRVPVILAGGPEALLTLPSEAEDDAAAGEQAVDELGLGSPDAIVAMAASGTTPVPLGARRPSTGRPDGGHRLRGGGTAAHRERSRDPDRDAAGSGCRLDPDGSRHCSEVCAQRAVDWYCRAARPCLCGPDGQHDPG